MRHCCDDRSEQRRAESLNWTGYVYGGLAHSTHIRYSAALEQRGEGSVRRGLSRMGIPHDAVSGQRVLDVGTGLYGLGFQRLGAVVEHHDISTRTVEALSAYARAQGFDRLSSRRTDLVSDTLPEEHFDIAYLSGIFQHLSDPARALTNLARSLKVGGHLYLDIYRSGRWRWFVVDVLRRILQRSDLAPTVARFAESFTLGDRQRFDLRQLELLVDDLFVEHLHLFRPEDVFEDARALGLEPVGEATSMNLRERPAPVDHSLLFAHVFNTLVFRKVRAVSPSTPPIRRTQLGRCQIAELDGLDGSYGPTATTTADFVLAHESGRFDRDERVSHAVNLFRMAHPCMTSDPYFIAGQREAPTERDVAPADPMIAANRHAAWSTFLSNVLQRPSPFASPALDSLGYEIVRFLSPVT